MNVQELLALFQKHFTPRQRRVFFTDGRAHLELKVGEQAEYLELERRLKLEVERRPGLLWVEVHQATRRAVFAFVPGSFRVEELCALVLEAELSAGLAWAVFGQRDYPGDNEQREEAFLELLAEATGLLVGLGLKLSPLPASRLASTLVSALAVVKAVPRLRAPIVRRLGEERAEILLAISSSLLLGPAQRPLQALVGVVEKSALSFELYAQQRLFHELEAKSFLGHGAPALRPRPARPVPLPPGPIEQYSDRAWAVALGGFAVSFLSTRSVQRAFGALFGGIPKPAKLGRELHSAVLARLLASRKMLVLDRDALRRLDRVDCLVLTSNLMPGPAYGLGRLSVCAGQDELACRLIVSELFDASTPLEEVTHGEYRLRPLASRASALPRELEAAVLELERQGELVLGLYRVAEDEDAQLLAAVELRIRGRLGLEELIQSAHEAGMQVVISSEDPEVLQSLPADDTLGKGDALIRGVRELERAGRVVCLVAVGDDPALDLADVAVSLHEPGSPFPSNAHIVTRGELEDLRFLMEAVKNARAVSRQSVNVSLGAASLGALSSVGGLLPMTSARVLTIVNLASLVSMGNGLRLGLPLLKKELPPPRDPTPWHALSAEGSLRRLRSSPKGLDRKQALERQARQRRPVMSSAWDLAEAVGDELFNPLVPLLAAGAGLSAVVGSVTDAVLVGGVIGLNAVVGGSQRFRTERAIVELSAGERYTVQVLRSGEPTTILNTELVKGDVLLLSRGDRVPADARVLSAEGLEVDASGLTGESLPVQKSTAPSFEESIAERSSMLYAGSIVTQGRAQAVVVAIGAETEARRGSAGFRSSAGETGVEKRMRELMDSTLPVALVAGVGVLGAGLLRGRKMDELVGSAVSLAVASVPEGLPLLATAAQLAAARRLSERGALVRNVRSLEALGRVDTLCFDKTGTVTEGTIELAWLQDEHGLFALPQAEAGRGAQLDGAEELLRAAFRACSSADEESLRADPLELAVHRSALQLGLSAGGRPHRLKLLHFEATRATSGVLLRQASGPLFALKGAPEAVLKRCALTEAERAHWLTQAGELAGRGLRVLAVAERQGAELETAQLGEVEGLELRGLLAFRDPVRASARAALSELRQAGLRLVMITGDHPATAGAICEELGFLESPVMMTGSELSNLDDDALAERVGQIEVFARVSPAQKVRIVRALGRAGRTVAMLGDGANDAPAIRLASVGVAMGERCSEAARAAADVVLTQPRVEILVSAIIEGRALWDSVRDAVSILVGGNLGEIGFTLLGGLISGRPPLTPRQLLLVNLFTDIAPATALAVRAPLASKRGELVASGPDASLGEALRRDIISRAVVTTAGAGMAYAASSLIGDRKGASTTALLALVGTQLGQTLSSGETSSQVVWTNLLTTWALGAIVQTPILSGAFGCRPLGPVGWGIALSSSALATVGGRYAPTWLSEYLAPYFPSDGRDSLVDTLKQSMPPAALSWLPEVMSETN